MANAAWLTPSATVLLKERMTRDIVEALMPYGKAAGAACVIEAEQLSLGEDRRRQRSVSSPRRLAVVSESSDQLRNEFLRAIST